MRFKYFLLPALSLFILTPAIAQSHLKAGIWRGALKNSSGNELPFNFEVKENAGKQQLVIMNGAERLKVTDIKFKGDSVLIHMPLFNSEFKLKSEGTGLKGKWIKHYADRDMAMDFTAQPGESWRFFKTAEKPAFNVTGRWSVTFGEGDKIDMRVGEFKQVGAKVTGTFLTTTGDDRYLEGTVAGNKLHLSTFDGGHSFLFTATIKDAKTLVDGKDQSEYKDLTNWTAVADANAKLPDAYSLTYLKSGYKKIAFSFPDVNGKKVSLSDSRFKNKVVIVQMLGSWCPNCMDETPFLVSYYKKFHAKGVEVIGLAYERTADFSKSKPLIQQVKNKFNVPYPLLITG
ncbi:MAG: peroxiredoxin family protein, partial [Mucilaginibacter sp.]